MSKPRTTCNRDGSTTRKPSASPLERPRRTISSTLSKDGWSNSNLAPWLHQARLLILILILILIFKMQHMNNLWFKRLGWFYRPVSWQGFALAILALAFCIQVFAAIDR